MIVTTEQVINRTKMRLLLMGTTHADAVLEKLINEAATHHINALDQFVISCETVEIDCYKARLPDGAVELIAYQFPDSTGCSGTCMNPHNVDYACSCPNWFVADRNVLTEFTGLGGLAAMSSNFFSVQGGYLVFPSTITQATVKIWFRGINLDTDGIAIIDEKQERALSAYAAWQYAIAHYKSYATEQRETWKREWVNQKQFLRGSSVQDDFRLNKVQACSIARALIMNPNVLSNRNI